MIKVDNLMIGDWLLDGDSYAQVTSIACGGIIETTASNFAPEEVLQPIPLTKEILERNGFYYDEDRKAYLMGVIFQVKPEKHGLFSFEICGCPYPLNTAHQLQHALRLCGLNELSDNFKVEE